MHLKKRGYIFFSFLVKCQSNKILSNLAYFKFSEHGKKVLRVYSAKVSLQPVDLDHASHVFMISLEL